MHRTDLIALAGPSCRECSTPVQRVENRWHLDEDGNWRFTCFMVCASGHRMLVEPLA